MLFWKKNENRSVPKTESKSSKEFENYGLSDILSFIKSYMGVDLFSKKAIMENKIRIFSEKRGIYSFEELYEKIKFDNLLKQELINLVTVSETYFFREEIQLNEIISYIKSLNRRVKILCAPCASGEEVYSIAIKLIEEGMRDRFEIFGIDINSDVIEKAKLGVYSERSLHKLNENLKNRYFKRNDDKYIIKQENFSMLYFDVKNVFNLDYIVYSDFDIILSRNMFIYFDIETRVKAMEIFSQLLKPDGRLYLGHADSPPKNSCFIESQNDMCYKKSD